MYTPFTRRPILIILLVAAPVSVWFFSSQRTATLTTATIPVNSPAAHSPMTASIISATTVVPNVDGC